jgi:nicotinamidase/pyrazinamidase
MKTMGVIVVDVQGDFTIWKKGALAVKGTDAAFIEKLRKATETLKQLGHVVLATQDWHPADHISFYTNHPGRKPFDMVDVRNKKQVLWPPHCVQSTENAKLLLPETFFDGVVKKGKDRRYDSYSGFQDDGGARTEMDGLLEKRGLQELVVYGIATDYCVQATALDAAKAGYKVTLVAGLSRGVAPDTTATALEEMQANGITIRKEL